MLAMLALPLICGIARAAFPSSRYTLALVWACPFLCALIAGAAVWFQCAVDDATGLADALRNSPAGQRGLTASRLLAAVPLCLLPISILVITLALT